MAKPGKRFDSLMMQEAYERGDLSPYSDIDAPEEVSQRKWKEDYPKAQWDAQRPYTENQYGVPEHPSSRSSPFPANLRNYHAQSFENPEQRKRFEKSPGYDEYPEYHSPDKRGYNAYMGLWEQDHEAMNDLFRSQQTTGLSSSLQREALKPDLVQLDASYMKMQQRHQNEAHSINEQRAERLQSLSDEEVYRQLYEQNQKGISQGKLDPMDKGILRPQSAPYYPQQNQTSQIPRSLINPELYDKGQMTDSDAQEKHDDVTSMLGGVPGGSPMLKAAQIMGQASQGASAPEAESNFKRGPVTAENLPVTESEWDTYEKNLDYSKGGHVGDMFGGKFPSHSKGYFKAPRMRGGKEVKGAHMGVDYSTPKGTDLPAPSDGILSPYGLGGATNQSGHTIRFYGNDNNAHKFMHMNTALDIKAVAKSLGRKLNDDGSLDINKGDIIGQTGNSGWPSRGGRNYAIHLHHEVLKLKEGQEHNYTATGLDRGQTRYDHVDPRGWMRSSGMAQSAPVKAAAFDEVTKVSPAVLERILEMKKMSEEARGG